MDCDPQTAFDAVVRAFCCRCCIVSEDEHTDNEGACRKKRKTKREEPAKKGEASGVKEKMPKKKGKKGEKKVNIPPEEVFVDEDFEFEATKNKTEKDEKKPEKKDFKPSKTGDICHNMNITLEEYYLAGEIVYAAVNENEKKKLHRQKKTVKEGKGDATAMGQGVGQAGPSRE